MLVAMSGLVVSACSTLDVNDYCRYSQERLIREADPEVVEEWKWENPVWSHDGILCTGETYKKAVKMTSRHRRNQAKGDTPLARRISP